MALAGACFGSASRILNARDQPGAEERPIGIASCAELNSVSRKKRFHLLSISGGSEENG